MVQVKDKLRIVALYYKLLINSITRNTYVIRYDTNKLVVLRKYNFVIDCIKQILSKLTYFLDIGRW